MSAPAEPTRPVVDFDHHNPPEGQHPYDMFKQLRETCPVAWSEHYGGFWVVSRYDDVARVLREHETFSSSRELLTEPGTSFHIPSMDLPESIPNELDPPESIKYRRLLNPLTSPAAVAAMADRVEHWTAHYLDRLGSEDQPDLLYGLAAPVPAAVTVEWIGLPLEDLEPISTAYHDYLGHPHGHERSVQALETLGWMYGRVREELERRRTEPRDDVLSYLLAQEVDGRPLTLDEAHTLAVLLIAGGVETTTTLIAWTLVHLHRDRDDRRRLIEEPELWQTGVDEILRRYPPILNHARVVRRDVEIGGCLMRRGERVMAPEASACHDADKYPEPERVILDRFPNRHLAFGLGTHRCAGMHLAKLEARTVMTRLLERYPEYSLIEDGVRQFPDQSTVAGWVTLPADLGPRAS